MKKWTYHHSFGALILLAGGLCLLIGILDKQGISLRTLPIRMQDWIATCLFFGFTVAEIWLLVWRLKSKNRWWKKAVAVLLLAALWLVCAYFTLGMLAFSATVLETKVFTSPDGEYSICITHEEFLVADWNDVYVITSPITMRRVDSLRDGADLTHVKVIWFEGCAKIVCGEESLTVDCS